MGYSLDCFPKELETELKAGDLKRMEAEEEEEEEEHSNASCVGTPIVCVCVLSGINCQNELHSALIRNKNGSVRSVPM